jgi:1-pyrroline-5-carboxylate dehydrogenase
VELRFPGDGGNPDDSWGGDAAPAGPRSAQQAGIVASSPGIPDASHRLNLLRWVSPRAIKETFMPPTDFRYPFMRGED